MKNMLNTQLEDIKKQFGFVVKSHRIGEMDLKLAQIDRVDDMVYEVYPEAVTTHGDAPVWMITWPSALGLAEYLLHNESVKDLRVLELGCGTAAPGIALSKAGAKVTCTDYDPLALQMASYNEKLNGCKSLETLKLDWYKPDLEGKFDLVVGSEVVYFRKSFGPLLSVLKRYTAPKGKIILSDQLRPQMEEFLKTCAKEGFSYRELPRTVYLPDHNQPIRIVILVKE